MSDNLTDAEWREFQSIPDQGYSHRAWIDHKITEQLAAAWDEGFDSGYDQVLVEKATASVAIDYRYNPYRSTVKGEGN